MNASRHTSNIVRGARLFSVYFWGLLRSIPVNFPVSFFYACMTPILVYLKYEATGNFGLTVFELETGLPWWVLVVIFGFCGLITAQDRSPVVYGLATLPMLGYAVMLLHGIVTGVVSAIGLTAVVYLTSAVLAVLGTLRYSVELTMVSRDLSQALAALERNRAEIDGLKERIRHGQPDRPLPG